jgi:hypothetical protein
MSNKKFVYFTYLIIKHNFIIISKRSQIIVLGKNIMKWKENRQYNRRIYEIFIDKIHSILKNPNINLPSDYDYTFFHYWMALVFRNKIESTNIKKIK